MNITECDLSSRLCRISVAIDDHSAEFKNATTTCFVNNTSPVQVISSQFDCTSVVDSQSSQITFLDGICEGDGVMTLKYDVSFDNYDETSMQCQTSYDGAVYLYNNTLDLQVESTELEIDYVHIQSNSMDIYFKNCDTVDTISYGLEDSSAGVWIKEATPVATSMCTSERKLSIADSFSKTNTYTLWIYVSKRSTDSSYFTNGTFSYELVWPTVTAVTLKPEFTVPTEEKLDSNFDVKISATTPLSGSGNYNWTVVGVLKKQTTVGEIVMPPLSPGSCYDYQVVVEIDSKPPSLSSTEQVCFEKGLDVNVECDKIVPMGSAATCTLNIYSGASLPTETCILVSFDSRNMFGWKSAGNNSGCALYSIMPLANTTWLNLENTVSNTYNASFSYVYDSIGIKNVVLTARNIVHDETTEITIDVSGMELNATLDCDEMVSAGLSLTCTLNVYSETTLPMDSCAVVSFDSGNMFGWKSADNPDACALHGVTLLGNITWLTLEEVTDTEAYQASLSHIYDDVGIKNVVLTARSYLTDETTETSVEVVGMNCQKPEIVLTGNFILLLLRFLDCQTSRCYIAIH